MLLPHSLTRVGYESRDFNISYLQMYVYVEKLLFYRHYEFQNVYPESINKEKMIAILFSNIPQMILSCIISLRKLQIEADRSIETVGIKHYPCSWKINPLICKNAIINKHYILKYKMIMIPVLDIVI